CAVVDRKSPRQHQAQPAAVSSQRERAFQEWLIEIDMSPIARWIRAGLTNESEQVTIPSGPFRSGVAAQHFPRGVPDHGIETRTRFRLAILFIEDVGELERPVKESVRRLDRPDDR